MLAPTLISIVTLVAGLAPAADRGDAPDVVPPAAAKADGAAKDAKPAKAEKKVDPFAEVTRLKRSASGKEAEEKHAALTAAAKECERIAKGAGLEPAVAAEAHWRAGELWRTLRHEEEARGCFTATTRFAEAAPRLAARAWLELGHLDRRAKRWDDALASYRRVVALQPEQRRESASAFTWQGKVLLAKGDAADGHALLLSVGARFPELPLDDVRNVDTVACDWIEAGRLEEARDLVADCLARHAPADTDDPSEEADDDEAESDASLRRALDKMKSRKLLAAPDPDDAKDKKARPSKQ
jgi:tetratricopeptide (TPR) repeat protein